MRSDRSGQSSFSRSALVRNGLYSRFGDGIVTAVNVWNQHIWMCDLRFANSR
jgi:hypothetical protein